MDKEKIKKFIIKYRMKIIDCIGFIILIALLIIPVKYLLPLLEILTIFLKEVTTSGMSDSFKLLFIGFLFYLTIQYILLIINLTTTTIENAKDIFK